tara:strand:- start:74 stop:421 length:348 start_codon:yes stop_codon:yes gene_type:complete
MTHSIKDFLNPPEKIVSELKKIKDQQAYLLAVENQLKLELESHFENQTINGKFISQGMVVSRAKREGKFVYSEFTEQYAAKLKRDLELRMANEREEGLAKQKPPTYYWTVRTVKK